MTRLEIAKAKAERLEREMNEAWNAGLEESRQIPFGQPNIIGRGDIYAGAKRKWAKAERLAEELETQNERVKKLERREYRKENNLTSSGGLQTSVANIDALKKRIAEREEEIANGEGHAYSKQYLRKDKLKLQQLEALQEKAEKCENAMSDKTIELIENGQVTQWKKQPIYYFVKGLRKVALVINLETGNFEVASKYPTKNDDEERFIKNLLG